jgi:hypothetical protein
MQSLNDRHGPIAIDAALRHLSIRLRAAPDTAGLAPSVDAARAAVATTHEAWRQAVEERVALTAEIAWLDTELDAAVAALAREALVLANGNRRDARYLRLFPSSPSVATKGVADDGELQFVRAVSDVLAIDGELTALAAHRDRIGAALGKVDDALSRREVARLPELRAANDRGAAMDAARRVYNRMYPQLQVLLPDQEARVESFFKDLTAASTAQETPAPQVG